MVASRTAMLIVVLFTTFGLSLSVLADQREPNQRFPERIKMDDDAAWVEIIRYDGARRQSSNGLHFFSVPASCKGRPDSPHYSRTGDNSGKSEITAKAWIKCGADADHLYIENQIFRNHFAWWGDEGKKGKVFRRNAVEAEAVAVTVCNIDLYRNTAFLEVYDYGDQEPVTMSAEAYVSKCSR